jgi:hypothetical protein
MLQAIRQHLRDADETYFQHCGFAWRVSARLLGGSLAAFVHGIAPFAFESTAGDVIRELYSTLMNRGPRPKA